MNENLANEIRKTIESIKDMKVQASGINNYLSTLENLVRNDITDQVDEAYQRGLEEGKAVNDKGCEGCKYSGTPQGDSPCFNCSNYYKNNWTAKDDKIEVGDEVEVLNSGSKYLIAWFAGTSLCGFAHDGVTCRLQPSDVRKTGRHFDIQKILEEMKA